MNLFLKELSIEDKNEVLLMCEEFRKENSEDPFEGINNFGRFDTYENFLEDLSLNKHIEDVNPKYVSQTTLGLFDEKGHIYGAINIRHYLVESLMKRGGNIGYAIRPSERRKGYASLMLRLGIEKAREMGVNKGTEFEDKLLVTCRKDNIGSSKTILNCFGKLASEENCEANDSIEQTYWIDNKIVLDKVSKKSR